MISKTKRSLLVAGLAGGVSARLWASAVPTRRNLYLRRRLLDAGAFEWSTGDRFSALRSNLKAFCGNNRGWYVATSELQDIGRPVSAARLNLFDQFERTFNGPVHPAVQLPEGYEIIGASFPHQPFTKAFLVTLGNSAQIVAAAFLHQSAGRHAYAEAGRMRPFGSALQEADMFAFPLRARARNVRTVDAVPTLTIFHPARTRISEMNDLVIRHVKAVIEEQNAMPGLPPQSRLARIKAEMRVLAG